MKNLSRKQNKLIEVYTSKRSLLGISPQDFDMQEQSKRIRLERLGLMSLNGKLVLDAGCGPGTYGLLLVQRNEVIGVDISLDALRMARKRTHTKGSIKLFML